MGRMKLSVETDEQLGEQTLEELIPSYYENKQELDSYKKICDAENAKIKDLMVEVGEDEYTVGDLKAKRTVIEKESMNEEKLMKVLRKHKIEGVIKTKEYVDMDAFESYLYNNVMTSAFAADLATCKTTTEVVQLRITRKKAKKGEDE